MVRVLFFIAMFPFIELISIFMGFPLQLADKYSLRFHDDGFTSLKTNLYEFQFPAKESIKTFKNSFIRTH